jgi:hypothetical protein
MGILFLVGRVDNETYGEIILQSIGIYPWEKVDGGASFAPFYSLIIFIPAFFIGHKFKNNLGAVLGKILSIVFIVLVIAYLISFILHELHVI